MICLATQKFQVYWYKYLKYNTTVCPRIILQKYTNNRSLSWFSHLSKWQLEFWQTYTISLKSLIDMAS